MLFRTCAFALASTILVVCRLTAQVATPPAQINADSLLETVRTLSSDQFEGRRTGTPGNAKARAWIVERFRDAGLLPPGGDFHQPFKFTRAATGFGQTDTTAGEGVNIVGTCRGSGAKTDAAMLITAHYDHLGVRDGAIYHGADDNASGVAVLLELARHCRKYAVDARRGVRGVRRRGARAAGRASVCRGASLLPESGSRSTSTSTWSAAARHASCTWRARITGRPEGPCSSRWHHARRSRCCSATTSRSSLRAGLMTGRCSPITVRFMRPAFRLCTSASRITPTITSPPTPPTRSTRRFSRKWRRRCYEAVTVARSRTFRCR